MLDVLLIVASCNGFFSVWSEGLSEVNEWASEAVALVPTRITRACAETNRGGASVVESPPARRGVDEL